VKSKLTAKTARRIGIARFATNDITKSRKHGLEIIKELRARDLKLNGVWMHDEALYADRVLRAGADGYIMKQAERKAHER